MNTKNYQNKKVLILGLGLNQGGVGAAKFFAKARADVLVTDIKTSEELESSLNQLKDFSNINYHLGGHKYEDIDWADLIIRNPALKPDNPYRIYAEKSGKPVELDMGIFLQFVSPKQIIGITGTKGKSTTSSLIYEVLKNNSEESTFVIPAKAGIHTNTGSPIRSGMTDDSGKKIILAGNIGKSVLDSLEQIDQNTLIVLELSSFQLEAFEKHQVSPHWALITNIYPDHLNYYSNMEDYINAKKIIAKFQTKEDFLFINNDDTTLTNPKFLQDLHGQITKFSKYDLPQDLAPLLPGEHNRYNTAGALIVSQNIGIERSKILETIKNFKGVDFRLQFIKEVNGIKIYNDSAATTPDATIQALKALPNSILICGGMNKSLEYVELTKTINKYAKSVYFLEGDATEEIKKQFKILSLKFKIIQGTFNNLLQVLQIVKSKVKPGDKILFSPAATSFNLFQNEFDRGRKFNEAVEKIFK